MKTNNKISALIFISLLLSSCASTRFTNLYNSLEPKGEISGAVDVNVTLMPLPKPKKADKEKAKTFFDLRDSIPHTFLKVIGAKAADETKIIEAIKADLSVPKEEPKSTCKASQDLTEIKIRLLFSNIKKYFKHDSLLHPGTRIAFLNTTVKVSSPEDIYIYTIDRLENEFESIDMGTLERTHTVDFSTGLSGEATGTVSSENGSTSLNNNSNEMSNSDTQNVYDAAGHLLGTINDTGKITSSANTTKTSTNGATLTKGAKADIKYSSNEVIKEALKINYNRLKTGFTFNGKELTVSQRGKPLSDISDNVFVTATLKFNELGVRTASNHLTSFTKLYDKEKPLKANNIEFKQYNYESIYCSNASDISLDISHEGLIRAPKLKAKGRNVLEYDDKVQYYTFQDTIGNKITIPKNSYCEDLFYISADHGDKTDLLLNIKVPGGFNETLFMHLNDNPVEIIAWIKEQKNNPTKANLQTKKVELSFEKDKGDSVPLVQTTMADEDIKNFKKLTNIQLRKRDDSKTYTISDK